MAFNEGRLYFWTFAKYAVAFPSMSRSIFARASSARRRLISNCAAHYTSAATGLLQLPRECALAQFATVCSTTPKVRAASVSVGLDSATRTAPLLELKLWVSLLLR
jgi:hypothetical protein